MAFKLTESAQHRWRTLNARTSSLWSPWSAVRAGVLAERPEQTAA